MSNDSVYIYALRYPVSKQICYVGQTKDPQKRFGFHLFSPSTALSRWINILDHFDLEPILEILEKTTEEQSYERERYWIRINGGILGLLNSRYPHHPGRSGRNNSVSASIPSSLYYKFDDKCYNLSVSKSYVIHKLLDMWISGQVSFELD